MSIKQTLKITVLAVAAVSCCYWQWL